MLTWLRRRLTYSNTVASLALFVALGGTSYAAFGIDSAQVVDNSLRSEDLRNNTVRSRDIRERTIRARDVGRNALGGGVVNEQALGTVPRAMDAQRTGGATAQELRVRCPADTVAKADVCIETVGRPPTDFLGAANICGQIRRGLPTMAQLDRFARSSGPLAAAGEWTSSVYLETSSGSAFQRLEALVMSAFGEVSSEKVNTPMQHAFRCVALPSN